MLVLGRIHMLLLLRSLSAVSQRLASKPRLAALSGEVSAFALVWRQSEEVRLELSAQDLVASSISAA